MPFDNTHAPEGAPESVSRQKVWDMIEAIGVCMLASHDGERIRARPMSRRLRFANTDAIYFLTDVESPKTGELAADPNVCLTFVDAGKGDFLCISGEARLLDDRPLIRALWRGADGAFWESPETPSLRALEVTPREAQFWDGRGGLIGAVQLMAAAALGPHDGAAALGANDKIKF